MRYLVIDAGGTATKYSVMDEEANIKEAGQFLTPDSVYGSLEEFVGKIAQVYRENMEGIKGIALSMPGIIDSQTGYCYTGGHLRYLIGHNIVQCIADKCQIPVTVENDGKCAALAEKWKGSLQNVENGAVLILGTAVGGGLIIKGELYKGSHCFAGEYSYLTAHAGCYDSLDGYWGVNGSWKSLAKETEKQMEIPEGTLNGHDIFRVAGDGNEKALYALDQYTKKLAVLIYNLQMLIDPEVIAVGGGISQQPLLLEYIQKNVSDFFKNSPYEKIIPHLPMPEITTCHFFNNSNQVGALYHHLLMQRKQ